MAVFGLETDARLDSLRLKGDPVVDALFSEWFAQSNSPDTVAQSKELHRQCHISPSDMSPQIRSYFENQPPVPSWVDWSAVTRGQELFEQWGLLIGMALFCASLPTTYAAANGAKVLMRTGRLMSQPKRRLFETGRLVFNTMTVGGLDVGAPGWQTVRRVRLIHSAVRHLVLSDPGGIEADGNASGPWDMAWGVPVNQEDLLGVLLSLSVVVIDALRENGTDIEEVDARSYLHAWNLVGYLIGIQEDLLPIELHDARLVFEKICKRQFAPSLDGRFLTEVLLEFIGDILPPSFRHSLPQASLRHFLKPRAATILGVPEAQWSNHLVDFFKHTAQVVSREEAKSRLVRKFAEHTGRSMWKLVLAAGDVGDRQAFQIPSHLADGWGLEGPTVFRHRSDQNNHRPEG